MSKKDDGQTGEGGLDLRSLKYGTLNWLRDDDINNSGDRRRGNPLSFLAQALSKAYGIDTLKGVGDYRGIVIRMDPRPKSSIPTDRAEVLNNYLRLSLGDKIAAAFGGNDDATVNVYKVYIPEIEMRPPPNSQNDPVIDTYFDVYDGRVYPEDDSEIPVGTVVTVQFEDFKNLTNPRITSAEKKPLIIKGLTDGGNILEKLTDFFRGNPEKQLVTEDQPGPGMDEATSGDSGGAGGPNNPFTGDVPRAGPDDPYPTRMSEAAREAKRKAEGTVLKLYNDPLGYCTIGKGHLIQGRVPGHKGLWKGPCSKAKEHGLIPAKWLKGGIPPDGNNTRAPNETMTAAEAEALFIKDVEVRERALVGYLRKHGNNVKLTQNQFDALMSVVYNSGDGNAINYIIKPYLSKGDFNGAANAFTVYNQMGYRRPGHKKYRKGLNRLREKEKALFLTA